ncbi:MAG: hypothetical protein ACOCZJ_03895, partial [Thermoplasmatota archaeon]
ISFIKNEQDDICILIQLENDLIEKPDLKEPCAISKVIKSSKRSSKYIKLSKDKNKYGIKNVDILQQLRPDELDN